MGRQSQLTIANVRSGRPGFELRNDEPGPVLALSCRPWPGNAARRTDGRFDLLRLRNRRHGRTAGKGRKFELADLLDESALGSKPSLDVIAPVRGCVPVVNYRFEPKAAGRVRRSIRCDGR